MPKLQKVTHDDPNIEQWLFRCPGCGGVHFVNTQAYYPQPKIRWNGDADNPSFWPDITQDNGGGHCHFFVIDGEIEFMLDSWHALRGQRVDMLEFEEFG